MDRHGSRKKNGVLHQVVKQLADSVTILLQSISHLHISLALNTKQWVADYANKMSEYSRSTASPASPGSSWCFTTAIVTHTVTMVHKGDSCNNVQNLRRPLLGRCDRNSRDLVENYLPSAPFLESSACSSINDRFSVDNLQTAHVTRSNTMDPCDIQDALVDTA